MKKLIFVALVFFVAVNIVQSDDSSENSEELIKHVKHKHIRRILNHRRSDLDEHLGKLEKQCSGATEKLRIAVKQAKECDDKVDNSLTLCEQIQASTVNCTKPVIKIFNDCLPEKQKGLPDLAMDSIVSVINYLCHQTGESILELANPCIWKDLEETNVEMDACEEKVKAIGEKYHNNLPEKTDLCSSIISLRSCIQKRVNLSCKNPKTKNAIIGLFDSIVAPCSHLNKV